MEQEFWAFASRYNLPPNASYIAHLILGLPAKDDNQNGRRESAIRTIKVLLQSPGLEIDRLFGVKWFEEPPQPQDKVRVPWFVWGKAARADYRFAANAGRSLAALAQADLRSFEIHPADAFIEGRANKWRLPDAIAFRRVIVPPKDISPADMDRQIIGLLEGDVKKEETADAKG